MMKLSRRRFVFAVGAMALVPPAALPGAKAPRRPATHPPSPFAPFDHALEGFMQARRVPGGALAVVKDRRLVYTRGYGWADRKKKIPVRPESLFRIASVTKPITAVAVLQLVEEGRLGLEDDAFSLVPLTPVLAEGGKPDPRLAGIRVRHLLHHTGGWDRVRSGDPMFRSRAIAAACGVSSPPGAREIIRYMLGRPLDFDPGTRFAYSNFGYCVLGRLIECVAGMSYGTFVREKVLAPIGARRMRLGHSLLSERAPGEVRYYMADNGTAPSVFGRTPRPVPWPYGGFCLEAMDAHGGWLASVVDLARFAAALDDPRRSPLLEPETFARLYAPPQPPVFRRADGRLEDHFYACGWLARPVGRAGQANYWHNGSLPGTYSLLVRRWDGLSWAVLFNLRSEKANLPNSAIDPALHRAANAVGEWPRHDLFTQFPE